MSKTMLSMDNEEGGDGMMTVHDSAGNRGGGQTHPSLQEIFKVLKIQVHIANFVYLQVQTFSYLYLHFEILAPSTHS